jgi:acyl-CoA synthetase (AMP-forming)/AMP-acid ligase II
VRNDEIEGVRLDRLRAFWNAAEKVHLETIQAFHERFEPFGLQRDALKTNYGLAENVGGATFSDPHGPLVIEEIDQLILQQKGIAHPVTEPSDGQRTTLVVGVGRPHPEIEVKILSQDGRALPEGHVGEIALKTPSRMSGYLGDPDETHRALYGDLLRTGDMGYVRDNQLFWMGRVRERITTMGKKVDPSYFEHILLNIPDLRQGCFAAFGVDDTKIGTQRIVIIAEVRDNISRPYGDIISDIRGQVQAQLGLTADDVLLVPKNTLTKTSSGKRRHRHFRQLYLNGELQSLALS